MPLQSIKVNFIFSCIVLSLSLYLFSCKQAAQQKTETSENNGNAGGYEMVSYEKLPEDFKEFYEKFHQDSLFQKEHIFFPLEGLPDNADPEYIGNDQFFWTADQWQYQNGKGMDDPKFERIYTNLANVLIEERIQDKTNQLTVIRRFSKSANDWRLIYYAGLNMYSRK